MLRRFAIVIVVLGASAGGLGLTSGRRMTEDAANCQLRALGSAFQRDGIAGRMVTAATPWNLIIRGRDVRPAEACEPALFETAHTAIDPALAIALLVVAAAGLLVIALPRRALAGAWVVVGMVGGFLAFVLTRTIHLDSHDVVSDWSRYTALTLAAAVALGLVGLAGWLLGSTRNTA